MNKENNPVPKKLLASEWKVCRCSACYGEGGFCVFMGFRLKLMLMLKVVKR